MTTLNLINGLIYDPLHNKHGVQESLLIRAGKIISPQDLTPQEHVQQIDLHGDVVMPGGVEMHCHIVGPAVQAARSYMPQLQKGMNGEVPLVPHARATGHLFAGLGYTTAIDAAVPGVYARQALAEFRDTPYVDHGFLSLMGNHKYVMEVIRKNQPEKLQQFVAWSLHVTHGYGVKIVNPGGVENWKQISHKTLRELDAPVTGSGVTPRQIVRELARAVDALQLPHAAHIHCNNLGYPGNWQTTLHTMQSLEGLRGHFAHIQFHSYAGDENDPLSFASGVDPLVEYVNSHPEITVDVGHVTPGAACTITGDSPFAEHLARLSGGRWFTADVEQESSCGVIPGKFTPYKTLIHAVQWAISLEWYLKIKNPWQLAMTSDHPNGGAFTRYPEIIALLMNKNLRDEMLAKMPSGLSERSNLKDLTREYTLEEIAIITRGSPAKILGLTKKGHLGVGADADITVYRARDDKREMFQRPRTVWKAGSLVHADGELAPSNLHNTQLHNRNGHPNHLHNLQQKLHTTNVVSRDLELQQVPADFKEWFEQSYSMHIENYIVQPQCINT
jgi:formylmethanofuran dehydrogenase subunit A